MKQFTVMATAGFILEYDPIRRGPTDCDDLTGPQAHNIAPDRPVPAEQISSFIIVWFFSIHVRLPDP